MENVLSDMEQNKMLNVSKKEFSVKKKKKHRVNGSSVTGDAMLTQILLCKHF